jgi:regulator of RNase E activity RraB
MKRKLIKKRKEKNLLYEGLDGEYDGLWGEYFDDGEYFGDGPWVE